MKRPSLSCIMTALPLLALVEPYEYRFWFPVLLPSQLNSTLTEYPSSFTGMLDFPAFDRISGPGHAPSVISEER